MAQECHWPFCVPLASPQHWYRILHQAVVPKTSGFMLLVSQSVSHHYKWVNHIHKYLPLGSNHISIKRKLSRSKNNRPSLVHSLGEKNKSFGIGRNLGILVPFLPMTAISHRRTFWSLCTCPESADRFDYRELCNVLWLPDVPQISEELLPAFYSGLYWGKAQSHWRSVTLWWGMTMFVTRLQGLLQDRHSIHDKLALKEKIK